MGMRKSDLRPKRVKANLDKRACHRKWENKQETLSGCRTSPGLISDTVRSPPCGYGYESHYDTSVTEWKTVFSLSFSPSALFLKIPPLGKLSILSFFKWFIAFGTATSEGCANLCQGFGKKRNSLLPSRRFWEPVTEDTCAKSPESNSVCSWLSTVFTCHLCAWMDPWKECLPGLWQIFSGCLKYEFKTLVCNFYSWLNSPSLCLLFLQAEIRQTGKDYSQSLSVMSM